MNTDTKWTIREIKKKIENLQMRLVKEKRLINKPSNATRTRNHLNEPKGSVRSSTVSLTPPEKHQLAYMNIARKFITFANSVCILYIQDGLKNEAYELLKKCSYLELELLENDVDKVMKWKGHLLYNYILCHFFGKSALTLQNLGYILKLSRKLNDTKIKNWDFLCSINFFAFYIYWKFKRYDQCIEALETAQKYVLKLMDNELPQSSKIIAKVQEVDEETEKEFSDCPYLESSKGNTKDQPKKKPQNQFISYYDTSDSEENTKENPYPHDQSQRYENEPISADDNDPKESRLCQLSKFNLFGLIKLCNASLVLIIQQDKQQALEILKQGIETLSILSEKFGSPIIAQNLLENLCDQIYCSQKCDDQTIKEVLISRGSRNLRSFKDLNTTNTPKLQGTRERSLDENHSDTQYIFATSDAPYEKENTNTSEGNEEKEELVTKMPLNPRGIINSTDFKTIMMTATFIPFIKPGIPRFQINQKEICQAKINFKKKEKLFIENICLRDNIISYNSRNNKETPIKNETSNISHHPELNDLKAESGNNNEIDEELDKSITQINSSMKDPAQKQAISPIQPCKEYNHYSQSGNPYNTRHPKPKRYVRNTNFRVQNNKSQAQYQRSELGSAVCSRERDIFPTSTKVHQANNFELRSFTVHTSGVNHELNRTRDEVGTRLPFIQKAENSKKLMNYTNSSIRQYSLPKRANVRYSTKESVSIKNSQANGTYHQKVIRSPRPTTIAQERIGGKYEKILPDKRPLKKIKGRMRQFNSSKGSQRESLERPITIKSTAKSKFTPYPRLSKKNEKGDNKINENKLPTSLLKVKSNSRAGASQPKPQNSKGPLPACKSPSLPSNMLQIYKYHKSHLKYSKIQKLSLQSKMSYSLNPQ
ncbi:unnamed protein product [Moneuplotes crassus]|uniref:Uncharacterized protein n=1 Tax=Euplotes crassus TaxID=5936 RepID=A0AAD1UG19_EUPCR|nr:unnamed protein product [Moneuplotes crassus]